MRRAALVFFSILLSACGGGESTPPDAPLATDAPLADGATEPDAGPTIEDLPVDETRSLSGLSAPVEVVRDTRGTPHIYAHDLIDAVRVQGYLMARDRFGQMEFLRRLALGRLSEVAALPDLLNLDRDSRFIGYNRQGKAIYDSLAPTDPSRQVADAFVAGVNGYIDEILAASDRSTFIPAGAEQVMGILFASPFFGHWEPADVFVMARYQATSLSYSPNVDVQRTRALAGVLQNLDASRRGAFVDLFSERPARRVYTRPGFPADQAKPGRARALASPRLPSIVLLDAALVTLEAQRARHAGLAVSGSNNWVVAGTKTASGAPMLANDPHLALTSPPVWWYVHIDTKRFGGPTGVNVSGVAFASLPGVVLGFNEDLAWGATVTEFDTTDVYEEVVTDGDPPTVLFRGAQVPIQTITEVIRRNGDSDVAYAIEVVPHHGPIIPGTRMGGRALSVRFTGHTPSNELGFFLGLTRARTIDEAFAAQRHFRVGSQNFVYISRDGDIAWNTDSAVPVRDPRALDLSIAEDGTVSGHCPMFVLPGTGDHEWTGEAIPSERMPHDRNPTRGYIATANQDAVGTNDDGNPCNQAGNYYLGDNFEPGYRMGRIAERLEALIERGDITKDDMIALQAEARSQLGDTLRDPVVEILGRVTAAGNATFSAGEKADLVAVRARLLGWSRRTPHGVGATDEGEIADSIATTIFNVGLTRIVPLAFGDEVAAIGVQPSNLKTAVVLERAIAFPELLATTQDGDTVLWDDLTTEAVETKDEIVGRGFLAALAFLRTRLGPDVSTWRWGRLHTVRFNSILPFSAPLSIPPPGDATFPDGFPRHGDFAAVDVANFGLWAPTSFMYTSGPSQRLVVEMLPSGPRAYNSLPGGQSIFPGPHRDDEARLWAENVQPPLHFTEADVVKNKEARLRFQP